MAVSTSTALWRVARPFLGALSILLALSIVIPLVVLFVVGRSVGETIFPKYTGTLTKVERAELMRAYAAPVDSSITPLRAGRALAALGSRKDQKPQRGMRVSVGPPVELPASDTSLFKSAGASGWSGPASQNIITLAAKGFSREEMQYLARLDSNPVWSEYSTAARAKRVDIAGGLYDTPFPDDLSIFELPIPRFAATKELAYASVARAAYRVASKRNADAELVLREIVSNGFHYIDDGNTLIEALIGAVIVGIGRDGLQQFYAATANSAGARISVALAAFDSAHTKADTSGGSMSNAIRTMKDANMPRAIKFEYVTVLSVSPCTGFRSLMTGMRADVPPALAEARAHVVRSASEGEVFDLATHALDRAPAYAARQDAGLAILALRGMSSVSAFLLRNPRIANCMALLAGGITA